MTSESETPKSVCEPARKPWLGKVAQRPIAWLALWLLVAAGCLWFGLRDTNQSTQFPTNAVTAAQQSRYQTKAIRNIQPMRDWVLADNPETETDLQNDFGEVDPPNWRIVHFRITKEAGDQLDFWLGRPLWYLDEIGATEIGQRVWIEMEEFGAVGDAELLAIDQCPQPPPQPSAQHRLVTGNFVHSSGDFLNVFVDGIDGPIATTGNHLFWSTDRREFVPASELKSGESLQLADHTNTLVTNITRRPGTEPAYNLEVDGEHVYYVSEQGVLVHNAYYNKAKYDVYIARSHGKVEYVGITKSFKSRSAAHARQGRDIELIDGLGKVGYRQARALEHKLIRKYEANGILSNVQRGVSARSMKKYTQKQWDWADDMIIQLGL